MMIDQKNQAPGKPTTQEHPREELPQPRHAKAKKPSSFLGRLAAAAGIGATVTVISPTTQATAEEIFFRGVREPARVEVVENDPKSTSIIVKVPGARLPIPIERRVIDHINPSQFGGRPDTPREFWGKLEQAGVPVDYNAAVSEMEGNPLKQTTPPKQREIEVETQVGRDAAFEANRSPTGQASGANAQEQNAPSDWWKVIPLAGAAVALGLWALGRLGRAWIRMSSGYHEARGRMNMVTRDWDGVVRQSDELIKLGRVDKAKRLLDTAAEEFSSGWDYDGLRAVGGRFARMGDTERAQELLSLAEKLEQLKQIRHQGSNGRK